MQTLAFWVGLPSSAVMVIAWVWARKVENADFLLRVAAGLVGGIQGTIGYDLVRIPFHLAGQNPFSPIRAYGVWLSGAAFSSPFTDGLGFLYHLSNGITFGWIYSYLFLRRSWAWGVLWGLLLETIAVSTAFGEVFRLRSAYGALSLAYAAHLFYGFPLGVACRQARTRIGPATPFLLTAIFIWFLSAWQPIGRQPSLRPGEMVVGREAFYPGWSDRPLGSEGIFRNSLAEPVWVKIRRPTTPLGGSEELVIPPLGSGKISLSERGIYQLGVAEKPWRSIFISVQEEGRYRP